MLGKRQSHDAGFTLQILARRIVRQCWALVGVSSPYARNGHVPSHTMEESTI